MTSIEITEDTWWDISQRLPAYALMNAKSIDENSTVYLAISHEGFRHVLLKVSSLEDTINDKRSRGLNVTGKALAIKDNEASYIVVTCTDRDGHKVFNMVATDIIHLVIAGMERAQAVIKTLEKWRNFWGGSSRQILSEEEIKGLFGELWFLLFWLLPKDIQRLRQWAGPHGSRHDFEFRHTAIEAKTTAAIRGHIHRIHGIDQLIPPEEGELLFFSLRLRQEYSARNSLPMLIERITRLLGQDQELLDHFNSLLAMARYSPLYNEQYSEYRYRVIDERLYRVNEAFPKITINSFVDGIPIGVERVDYDINLEVAQDLLIAEHPSEWHSNELE